ncbi:hypothetical protein [Pseudomonas sp. URMO17WK12:I12]
MKDGTFPQQIRIGPNSEA